MRSARRDFLITPVPPVAEGATPADLIVPHIAVGGGYTTELIVLTPAGAASGRLSLFTQNGEALPFTRQ